MTSEIAQIAATMITAVVTIASPTTIVTVMTVVREEAEVIAMGVVALYVAVDVCITILLYKSTVSKELIVLLLEPSIYKFLDTN